jgi:hypothetical protein
MALHCLVFVGGLNRRSYPVHDYEVCNEYADVISTYIHVLCVWMYVYACVLIAGEMPHVSADVCMFMLKEMGF